MIEENLRMKGPQKLGFLNSNLTGNADYRALRQRTNFSKQIIIFHLFSTIPTSTSKAEDVRKILDTTVEALRGLKNLNRPIDGMTGWSFWSCVNWMKLRCYDGKK